MKKIVSILLCAVILLTPVMSLAAPKLLSRSNAGSAMKETIMLNNEFAITIPQGMILVLAEEANGTEQLLYFNEDGTEAFFLMALPLQKDPEDEVTKSMNKAVGQISDKPTKALLDDAGYVPVQLPDVLAEMLGDAGTLYYMNNGVTAGLQLVFMGSEGYVYGIIHEGLAGTEEAMLAHLLTLRKF